MKEESSLFDRGTAALMYSLNFELAEYTDLAVVPRERPHPGAAAREQPRDSPVIES